MLTVEWFNNNKITVSIERNTCLGQRICWFSYRGDSKQLYSQRWGTMYKLELLQSDIKRTVNGEIIGKFLDRWIKHPKYEKYDSIKVCSFVLGTQIPNTRNVYILNKE